VTGEIKVYEFVLDCLYQYHDLGNSTCDFLVCGATGSCIGHLLGYKESTVESNCVVS
jgi:hypothetical protein